MSDLIRREDAIAVVNAICERCGKYKEYNGVMCGTCALDGVEDSIEDLPSAVPTPHGRLIDADALIENANFYETEMETKEAPTVIEAEADHD